MQRQPVPGALGEVAEGGAHGQPGILLGAHFHDALGGEAHGGVGVAFVEGHIVDGLLEYVGDDGGVAGGFHGVFVVDDG